MGYWDWLEFCPGWEEAAGDCGLLGMQNAVVQSTAISHVTVTVRPELRRLGPYENAGNRMPPSVGILVVLLLAAFCIWKAVGR